MHICPALILLDRKGTTYTEVLRVPRDCSQMFPEDIWQEWRNFYAVCVTKSAVFWLQGLIRRLEIDRGLIWGRPANQ
jgi:hypothetical protein